MGMSIRAARIVRQQARDRLEARLADERRRTQQAARLHARWLSRERAAAHLGLSLHQLRRAMTRGTSPAYAKLGGRHKQAPVVFLVDHLDQFLADRAAHLAERYSRMTEAAELAALELPIS
jgi:AraC-like DNA-binding protein